MIVIVGAGLAGLSCALRLEEEGADWLLVEESSLPGGRVASDLSPEGYVLDHGFQVLLDSYPTARRLLDVKALQPRYFESGALLAKGSEITSLRNPLRSPSFRFSDLFPPFTLGERAALIPPFLKGCLPTDRNARAGQSGWDEAGRSTMEEIKALGLEGKIMSRFLGPFFAGVFLEKELSTDATVFRRDLRYFATGRALLPAGGMAAIPRQLAATLPSHRLRFCTKVDTLKIEGGRVNGIVSGEGAYIPCETLILATDEPATCALLGEPARRPWKGVTTLYFTGDVPLYRERMLVLPAWDRKEDGESSTRSLLHFTDLTNIAPEYAPTGKRLLSATLIGLSGTNAVEEARRVIGGIFPGFASWDFLKEILISQALPDEAPGTGGRMFPLRPLPNVRLAGDQVSRASIETALASGLDAALDALSTP